MNSCDIKGNFLAQTVSKSQYFQIPIQRKRCQADEPPAKAVCLCSGGYQVGSIRQIWNY